MPSNKRKMYKIAVKDQFLKINNELEILFKFQFGFRENYSHENCFSNERMKYIYVLWKNPF